MILYDYDKQGIMINEHKNNDDTEFYIKINDEDVYLESFQKVRSFFENNRIYTDVLFYTRKDHEYQIIVREDYYVDFILCLFKYRLLRSITWK